MKIREFPGPKARKLLKKKKIIDMELPIIVKTENSFIIDVDGYRFINLSGRYFFKEAVDLAEEIAILTPGGTNKKVFFSVSEAEIEEILIKIKKNKKSIVIKLMGEEGIYPPPLIEKIRQQNEVLISDERDFCLGYTGKMFITEHYGFIADVYIFKITEELFAISASRSVFTTHKNISVPQYILKKAIERVNFLKNEGVKRAEQKGNYLRNLLKKKICAAINGKGLVTFIQLFKEINIDKIIHKALGEGVILKKIPPQKIGIFPSLYITEREIEKTVEIISKILN